ncbi:MAG: peptidylprolyl isomerase [Pseudobdellovibrio sp.]|jgi:FKBP-type peptidyl-prolyl cis-trans isomerase SlyD|nr:peptidylprolyl isomerase [Pseudobdellovibrio sp.]
MNAQVISFNCILKNKAGKLISSSYNREVLTISGVNTVAMLSGLNRNLQNLKKGEKRNISLLAEEAYGFYDPKKIILFPRRKLPKNARQGECITIVSKTGVERTYRILDLHSDLASLDGNHPLAGQDLIFEIEALDARDATVQEIEESMNTVSVQVLH